MEYALTLGIRRVFLVNKEDLNRARRPCVVGRTENRRLPLGRSTTRAATTATMVREMPSVFEARATAR